MLTYVDVCSRMLTYAHVCSRMLTYAHVCSRMLTHEMEARRLKARATVTEVERGRAPGREEGVLQRTGKCRKYVGGKGRGKT